MTTTKDEAIKTLTAALKEARRAIGDHYAPNDCYATGPMTGDSMRDLVQCPACSAIAMYDAALAATSHIAPDACEAMQELIRDLYNFEGGRHFALRLEKFAPDAAAIQAEPVTLMTDRQASDWAWKQVQRDCGLDKGPIGDSMTYFGFFLHGWNYRAQYERQRPAIAPEVSLPERDTTKPAEQQGLFRKFDVRRVDGSDQPGGKHYGCRYFVLDLDHDTHAPAAMRAYAADCAETHPQLSADLAKQFPAIAPEASELPPTLIPNWAGEFTTFQQWVNKAQSWLESPSYRPSVCIDTKGRRCASGKDFMLARDEGAFPVRFFWDFVEAPAAAIAMHRAAAEPKQDLTSLTRYGWSEAYIGESSDLIEDTSGTYVKFTDVQDFLAAAEPVPTDEAQYLALRLKRVVRAAGVEVYEKWSDAQVAECAVTILGEIARKLEVSATKPATSEAVGVPKMGEVLYMRQIDIDHRPKGKSIIVSQSCEDEWNVPLYLAAPAAPTDAKQSQGDA